MVVAKAVAITLVYSKGLDTWSIRKKVQYKYIEVCR